MSAITILVPVDLESMIRNLEVPPQRPPSEQEGQSDRGDCGNEVRRIIGNDIVAWVLLKEGT